MKNQLNALLLTAALSGLVGGTSVAAQTSNHGTATKLTAAKAGLRYAAQDTSKHSCKGKNVCSGKGGCATDGSKPPAPSSLV